MLISAERDSSRSQKARFVTNLKSPPVYKVIVAQLAASAIIATIFLIFGGFVAFYSGLLGGFISVAANSFFAAQAFRFSGARNAKKIVQSFMVGEIGKFIIVVGLFALSFGLIEPLNAYVMMFTFVVAQIVGVSASARMNYSPSMNKNQ
jgi:ATP synthase protein I